MSHSATDFKSSDERLVRPIGSRRGPRFPFYTDLELASMPNRPAAIEGILFSDSLATIVAKYESFKTFIALEMAFCMAVGADYYGRRTAQGVVLYISAEGGHGIAARIAALRVKYGGFIGEFPLIVHTGAVDICDATAVGVMLADADGKLQEMGLAHEEIVAVFVDTVARNMVGDENSAQDMGRFVAGCDRIRERTRAVVVPVHHTGWTAPGSEPRSRGSIVLPSAVDTEITLSRDGDRVTLKCTKQKGAERFADIVLEASPMAGSLVFEAVELGSSKLTPNELLALQEVQSGSLRWGEWESATGLAKGSLSNVKKRLVMLGYVKQDDGKWIATPAGKLAIGSRFKASSLEVQSCGS